MRDFIYVKDCANVMWWLLENPSVNGIYNLGTGRARTWNDLIAAVFLRWDAKRISNILKCPSLCVISTSTLRRRKWINLKRPVVTLIFPLWRILCAIM